MTETEVKNQTVKMLTDYLPLVVFFVTYKFYGIFTATASLIVLSVLAVGLVYGLERRVPVMPLVTAILVLVFGGATLLLQDENLIKLKSTVVQLLIAAVLFGSVIAKRPILRLLFKEYLVLEQAGWRKMSLQYGTLFVFTAGLNEFIRLTQSTEVWVNFKVFGLTGIFILFGIYQAWALRRHFAADRQ